MVLVASTFAGRGRAGDFAWMIEQPEYADALFIFNDNEGEFRAHQRHAPGARQCHAGGGNAVIRPTSATIHRAPPGSRRATPAVIPA